MNKNIRDSNKLNLVMDLLITISFVIVYIVLKYAYLYSFYKDGLNSKVNILTPFLLPARFAIIIIFFVLLIIRIYKQGRLPDTKGNIIRIVFVGIFLVILIITETFTQSGYTIFQKGFEDKVRNEADIPAIRKWLIKIDQRIFDKYTIEEVQKWRRKLPIEESDWPTSITNLSPQYVYVGILEDNNYSVCLVWGWPIAHWGIIVGPETMDIYNTDLTFWGDIWVKVEPGVYVWYDD